MSKYNVARLKAFFFEAALATYASGKKAEPFHELAGAKRYWYQPDGSGLCYTDIFFVNGEYSGGQTTIWQNGVPAWIMQYHGWCKNDDPETLAFLRKALSAAYKQKKFWGGRGPIVFEDIKKGLTYVNLPKMSPNKKTDFIRFSGSEDICRERSMIFWHEYQGLLLDDRE